MQHWNKIWETVKHKIISYILKLEKKGYTIPIDDKNNELFTQNIDKSITGEEVKI